MFKSKVTSRAKVRMRSIEITENPADFPCAVTAISTGFSSAVSMFVACVSSHAFQAPS